MSKEIDEKVVSMKFDNKDFMNNTAETMTRLEKLKQSLQFKDVDHTAALSPLGDAAEVVTAKFSALGSFVHGIFERMGQKAFDVGQRIVSSFTIDPIKTGLSEYETQINAVQTILANTESKGTTLDDVNSALDTLNAYADKTIYNFTEMTRNIGTFTAAGVDLDTSVNAIQGIANLAAVSGSTSQQASTAMYQLSQALSSGTVKLMDWNSVVNAGMGGQVFQDALKETARVHDIAIDDMIEEQGSFRETLKEGWLTSEILTETLQKFTMSTEGLTEEQIAQNRAMLKSKGYTDEQIDGIFKLGNTATNAATKVKTFTQLMDTLKEAAQSGWTQTWEILIGDFEEAKNLWTKVSDVFNKIISDSAEARNTMLQAWADGGGRDAMLDSFKNIFEAIKSIVNPIREAFREIFPPATAEKLIAITESIRNFTKSLILSENAQNALKSTFKGLFAILDIGFTIVKAIAKGFITLVKSLSDLGGILFEGTGSLGDWIVKLRDVIKSSNVFTIIINGIVTVLVALVKGLTRVVEFIKESEILTKIISGIGKAFRKLGEIIKSVYTFLKEKVRFPALEGFLAVLTAIWSGIKHVFGKITEGVGDAGRAFLDAFRKGDFKRALDIFNGGIVAVILLRIKNFIGGFKDLKDGVGGILDGITGILDSVRGCFEAYQSKIKASVLMEIAKAIALLVASITVLSFLNGDKVSEALGTITILFTELMVAMGVVGKLGGEVQVLKITSTLVGFAFAVLILTSALKKIAKMDMAAMSKGFIGLAGLAAIVTIFATKLTTTLSKKKGAVAKCAGALLAFSAAVRLLVKAVETMGQLSWTEMAKGLIGVGALMAGISVFIKKTSMKQTMAKTAVGVLGMALAIKILASACKDFGSMGWEELAKGIPAIAILMLSLGAAMKLMPAQVLLKTTIGLLALVAALKILVPIIQTFGSMSLESLGKGLLTIGGTLGIFAISLKLMQGTLKGAAALVVAALALNMIAIPLRILGSMSLTAIGIALLALAGTFVVFGVAALVLSPLTGIIAALATSIVLMGVGMLAASLALTTFATGLIALGAAASVGAAGIVAAVGVLLTGMIGLGAVIAKALASVIAGICSAIVLAIGSICNAIAAVIVAVCQAIIKALPALLEMVGVVLDALLDLLLEYVPKLVVVAIELILNFCDALTKSMGKIVEKGVDMIEALLIGIGQQIGPLIEAAFQLILDFINGLADAIEEYTPLIMDACVDLGKAIVRGVVKGLKSIGSEVWNGIKSVGSSIKNGFKDFFGINSPAKEMEFIGQGIDEGIVVGLEEYKGAIVNASEDVGDSAINSMTKAISGISDVIDSDIDSQPVIRPVLDLSNIESGAGAINGMFGMTPSVDVLSNVGSINSMMSRNQNGGDFDIVSAIESLGSKIGDMAGNTYIIDGITYDDGSNVAGAVESIVRAARIERRI